jgi:hypothetical protein
VVIRSVDLSGDAPAPGKVPGICCGGSGCVLAPSAPIK